ncbi:hypothetical protein HZC20_02915 [Candidatus Peregrinibacteria bacterium]|nr:hypothetical protein [Candidatus Peregrinibacteria bacterium]
MKKTSFIFILGIIAVLAIGSYTGYLFYTRASVTADLKKADKVSTDYKEKVLDFENKRVIDAITAKKVVNDLKLGGFVKWSQVIKNIRNTIPKRSGEPLIEVLTYSGSFGSDISMNAKTKPGAEDSYGDVAEVIKAFDESENGMFQNTFVPSISSNVTDKGQDVLTFLVSTKYVGGVVSDSISR